MSFYQPERSLKNLEGVHPDLVAVVHKAVENMQEQVLVVEGLRSKERQEQLIKAKKSKTRNSRHLTGHAVDLVVVEGGKAIWEQPHSKFLADEVQEAADSIGVKINRGFDWGWDSPHFQLDWKAYPIDSKVTQVAKKVAKPVKKAPVSAVGAPAAAGIAFWWQSILEWITGTGMWLQSVAVEFSSLGPVKIMFTQAGANVQALTIGGLILAACIVAKKATQDD